MTKYFIKRLFVFVPMMLLVSLMAFWISASAPGDPVEILTNSGTAQGSSNNISVKKDIKDSLRNKLGLNKPLFYFSLNSLAECDTLHKIYDKLTRNTLSRLTAKYGNWKEIHAYYTAILNLQQKSLSLSADTLLLRCAADSADLMQKDEVNNSLNQIINETNSLLHTYEHNFIQTKIDSIKNIIYDQNYLNCFKAEADNLSESYMQMIANSTGWKNYVPVVRWHGLNSQYHQWLKNILLKGDFGISYTDGQPVITKIWNKFLLSSRLIIISIFLAYLISIPIGIASARRRGSWFEKTTGTILFMLYSLPGFFAGTMLLYWFANPDHWVWFPEGGSQPIDIDLSQMNFFERFAYQWPYMVLPIITYTYSSFAFISRIIRVSMLEVLSQDYIRTARAKGLSDNRVIYKHALRNALLPVITLFVNIFPAAVGGSVILETIFNYSGMGLAGFDAIRNYDYPMIVSLFTLSGFMTMIAYFVADLLYAFVDPRISY
jgi:peptide/nickel transport system permease protein